MTRITTRRSTAVFGGALLLLATVVSAALSCSPDHFVNPTDRGKACTTNADCPYYLACTEGLCRQRCAPGSYCPSGPDCSQCECRAEVCMPSVTPSNPYTPYTPPYTAPTTTTTGSAPPATTCPTSVPITAATIEAMNTWKPPAAIQAACTQQNIDDLRALLSQGSGSAMFTAIKTTLGAPCAACVFSPGSGTNWQPVVEFAGNTFLQNALGACLALLENASCGRAGYEVESCVKLACPVETCGSDVTMCNSKALSGPACKGLSTTLSSACPNLDGSLAICGDFAKSLIVPCAGGVGGGVN